MKDNQVKSPVCSVNQKKVACCLFLFFFALAKCIFLAFVIIVVQYAILTVFRVCLMFLFCFFNIFDMNSYLLLNVAVTLQN